MKAKVFSREKVWVPIASAPTTAALRYYEEEYQRAGRRTKCERTADGRWRLYAEFERPGW